MAYNAYALIDRNNKLSFADILEELSSYPVNFISSNEACIDTGNYKFNLYLNEDNYIEDETNELLRQYESTLSKSNFRSSNMRIEVYGEDDPNMDYFNDFLHIISKLAKHPSILVYEQAGEEFI